MQVVAFIKGTRTQPQCGFSHRVMTLLNELRANYEVVNVLDDLYNPGLREAIKEFSQWPTIPQVYCCMHYTCRPHYLVLSPLAFMKRVASNAVRNLSEYLTKDMHACRHSCI